MSFWTKVLWCRKHRAGLIVYRILKINEGVASKDVTRVGGGNRLTRVVRILVESGLLYTASVIVFFCTFLTSNNAQYGVSDVVSIWLRLVVCNGLLLLVLTGRSTHCELLSHKSRASLTCYIC